MSDLEPIIIRYDAQATWKAWSTNQDRNMNPYKRAELIALWKEGAIIAVRNYRRNKHNPWPFPDMKAIVQITIPFSEKRRRDPHNYCGTVLKAATDGLVRASRIPDDTPEFIGHREPILVVGKQPPELALYPELR